MERAESEEGYYRLAVQSADAGTRGRPCVSGTPHVLAAMVTDHQGADAPRKEERGTHLKPLDPPRSRAAYLREEG